MTRLDGSTVLVIGGAKNLGLAIARRAADLGADVVIGARDGTAAALVATGLPGNARSVAVDVTDEATIRDAAARLGAVDHVVVTAAAHHNVAVTDLDHDATVRAFEAKVIGPMLVAKHLAPTMPASGSITLFSGVAAWKPARGLAVMGITNGAVAHAARQLAADLAPIRVNAIAPGIVDSGTWDARADRDAFFASVADGLPVGRVGASDDIVDAALWVMTAGFVSGETVRVDGGALSA
ncbi:MAG: SDR family oxidoreductase [Gordonia paraffinivorans]